MPAVENVRPFNIPKRETVDSGSGDGQIPTDMNARLSKIEGDISGLKHSQNMLLGGLGIIAAIMLALGIFTLTKLDQQGDRLDKLTERTIELPSKVSAELRDIAKTLADSITAAKQTPPQVILMPASQLPQPTPPPTKQ